MLFGLVAYVVYRRVVEGTSLTKRVEVAGRGAGQGVADVEYGDILVPVFGTRLDDDIVGTAGRLADAADEPGRGGRRGSSVVYVLELPLTVPLDCAPPKERAEAANGRWSGRSEVGEEYETVEVRPVDGPGAQRRRRDRPGGARPRGRGDRDRRRAADPDPGRRGARRDRRRAAGRDRPGDRVRAARCPVPGAAHGAESDGSAPRERPSRDRRADHGRPSARSAQCSS